MNFSAVLTQYCNLHCKHCYLPSLSLAEKKADDLNQIACFKGFQNLGDQFGEQVEEIYLSGGEFLTLSYGEQVVGLVQKSFPRSKLFAYTNGLLFLEDPSLFHRVAPHVFHVGLDAWHKGIDGDGRSPVADRFLEYRERGGKATLVFHWTRKEGDAETYQAFYKRYQSRDVKIEDRSLNTTTGRAREFDTPCYRKHEVWRPCDFGEHVLLKYDGNCYACHYALPSTVIGQITDRGLRHRMDQLRESPLGQVMHSPDSKAFYQYVCSMYGLEFSPNRCLLCETFHNKRIDTSEMARSWLTGQ